MVRRHTSLGVHAVLVLFDQFMLLIQLMNLARSNYRRTLCARLYHIKGDIVQL